MYAYYSTVGSGTAGYPIQDTRDCSGSPCTYQAFDKSMVLFSYSAGTNEPQNITLRDPFFTKWQSVNGTRDWAPGPQPSRA